LEVAMTGGAGNGQADVDVIVAGAGAAGLGAALAAAQRGAEVLVLEATEHFREGSNTAMSTSMIPAGGTRFQAEVGIEDSPELFRADIARKTGGTAEPTVTRALTDVAPDLVHWLHDEVGVPLRLVTDILYPGHTALRCHSVEDRSGRTLHRHLLARTEQDGTTIMVPVRLTDVIESAAPGGPLTAVLERPDGSAERITARAVVLATSGFGADPTRVAQHTPEIRAALYHGGDGARGDALSIGERLGADVSHLDAYQGHGSVATPHGIILTWATVMHGAVLIDTDGERFGDETVGYSEFGSRVLGRPGGIAWTVYDERVHAACLPFKDYQDVVAAGAVTRHADVGSLAATMGAPVDRVRETVAAATAAARGAVDPHGRTVWEAPLEPPYLAVRITGALFHTQGGLRVDQHARVLRGAGPIAGLYAAGGSAVGISGSGASGYLAGNGLLAALGLGLLAGRHAATLS
jgi:fumarate reductase flavoprotein subunit